MHIAIFSATNRPRLGGITVSVLNTVAALRAAGVKTTLFAPSPPEHSNEAGAHFFPTIPWPLGGTVVRTAVPYSNRINREFATCGANIVHSFDPLFVGHAARRLARRHSLKTVLTYQTHYTDYLHFWPFGASIARTPLLREVTKRWVTLGIKAVCNSFDCVIVPTSATAQSLIQVGVSKPIEIIPVGFDSTSLSSNNLNIRRRLGLSSSAKVFLHLGRLSSEKNIAFLMRAFASALKSSSQELYLIIAGDGPERGRLERQVHLLGIERRVFFVGAVPQESVGAYYSAADAFLFSSLTETQGFVICESLMCGLPVIAIRANGPSDFVTTGVDGLLTENEEPAYVRAITDFISDNELQEKLRRGARIKASDLAKERYAASLFSLYSNLIN